MTTQSTTETPSQIHHQAMALCELGDTAMKRQEFRAAATHFLESLTEEVRAWSLSHDPQSKAVLLESSRGIFMSLHTAMTSANWGPEGAVRYTATFFPQSFVNGHMELTPVERPSMSWDCTRFLNKHPELRDRVSRVLGQGASAYYEAEPAFLRDEHAPEPVRDWLAPFTVRITREVIDAATQSGT